MSCWQSSWSSIASTGRPLGRRACAICSRQAAMHGPARCLSWQRCWSSREWLRLRFPMQGPALCLSWPRCCAAVRCRCALLPCIDTCIMLFICTEAAASRACNLCSKVFRACHCLCHAAKSLSVFSSCSQPLLAAGSSLQGGRPAQRPGRGNARPAGPRGGPPAKQAHAICRSGGGADRAKPGVEAGRACTLDQVGAVLAHIALHM